MVCHGGELSVLSNIPVQHIPVTAKAHVGPTVFQ